MMTPADKRALVAEIVKIGYVDWRGDATRCRSPRGAIRAIGGKEDRPGGVWACSWLEIRTSGAEPFSVWFKLHQDYRLWITVMGAPGTSGFGQYSEGRWWRLPDFNEPYLEVFYRAGFNWIADALLATTDRKPARPEVRP